MLWEAESLVSIKISPTYSLSSILHSNNKIAVYFSDLYSQCEIDTFRNPVTVFVQVHTKLHTILVRALKVRYMMRYIFYEKKVFKK